MDRFFNKQFDNDKTLLIRNAQVLNVFTEELEDKNVLIKGKKIVGVGDFEKADEIIDAAGKIVVPSFIDGHMHIESTQLTPYEFAKVATPHGTGAVVADPHEIANVCGINGINYMLQASKNVPMNIYYTIPSCVPATKYDESGATLLAEDINPLYKNESIIGLSEVMDFPSVIAGDTEVIKKITDAKKYHKVVCGHAPCLSGEGLQKYVSAGIVDDHECTSLQEAIEKLKLGQTIIIREGTSAKNIKNLSGLFVEKYWRNCIFCTDDITAGDILTKGHIDHVIRMAIKYGCKPINAIVMASLLPARHYKIQDVGAVSPGYFANLNIIDSLESINVEKVLHNGQVVYADGEMIKFDKPKIDDEILESVYHTFNVKSFCAKDFVIDIPQDKKIRTIEVVPNQILTNEVIVDSVESGDFVKIAVCERHNNTGNIGIGFLKGTGMKKGALASSISHDSHNLITFGKNESDMALAANTIREIGGGICIVINGSVVFVEKLPIAGLLVDKDGIEVAKTNNELNQKAKILGFNENINPFMTTGFCSLTVIPKLRLTTKGLFDVSKQDFVDLFV